MARKQITCYVTDNEKAALQVQADAVNLSLSEYAGRLLMGRFAERQPEVVEVLHRQAYDGRQWYCMPCGGVVNRGPLCLMCGKHWA